MPGPTVTRQTKVSPHFTFGELTRTDHPAYILENESPPPVILMNLVRLCADILEPARAIVGPLRVNSAYRCPDLNRAIGGSPTSRHMDGLACDCVPLDMDLADAYRALVQSGLPFDQIILEYNRWLHLGAAAHAAEPRRQALVIFTPGHYEFFRADDPRIA